MSPITSGQDKEPRPAGSREKSMQEGLAGDQYLPGHLAAAFVCHPGRVRREHGLSELVIYERRSWRDRMWTSERGCQVERVTVTTSVD